MVEGRRRGGGSSLWRNRIHLVPPTASFEKRGCRGVSEYAPCTKPVRRELESSGGITADVTGARHRLTGLVSGSQAAVGLTRSTTSSRSGGQPVPAGDCWRSIGRPGRPAHGRPLAGTLQRPAISGASTTRPEAWSFICSTSNTILTIAHSAATRLTNCFLSIRKIQSFHQLTQEAPTDARPTTRCLRRSSTPRASCPPAPRSSCPNKPRTSSASL